MKLLMICLAVFWMILAILNRINGNRRAADTLLVTANVWAAASFLVD